MKDKLGDNARKLYERLYAEKGFYHWFAIAGFSLRMGEIPQLISNWLKDSTLILDIGTGDGALFYAVSKLKPKSKIVGIDIASNAIHFAKQKLHEKAFIVASAECLPFRDNCFNGCYSSELIEHIPKPDSMLTDCFRVLKPNGILVITTPNPEALKYKLRKPKRNPYHLRLYNYQELIYIMEKNGFKIHKAIGTEIRFPGYGKLMFFLRKLGTEAVCRKILYFLGRLYPLALTLAVCCIKQ